MQSTRRGVPVSAQPARAVARSVRFQEGSATAYSILHGDLIVSYASRYVTPGTPNTTRKMSPGDVVEVDIEGIGVLRDKVVAG